MQKFRFLLIGLFLVSTVALWGCGSDETTQIEPVKTDPSVIKQANAKDWTDHTQGLEFVVGFQNGLNQAKEEDKPVMMFATTTWCGWCKRLASECFRDAEIKELLSQFVLTIVDGDLEQDALVSLGATGGFPHIVFVSNDGRKLSEQLGYASADDFQQVVEKALDKLP